MTASAASGPGETTSLGIHLSSYAASPPDAATRHLSAAAYLDENFCRKAIVDVYHERHRLVAPSYGFDVLTVLHHCRRARRGYVWRDGALTCCIVLGLVSIVGIPAVITLLVSLAGLRYVQDSVRRVRTAARGIRSGAITGTLAFLRELTTAMAVSTLGLLLLGGSLPLLLRLLAVLQSSGSMPTGLVNGIRIATVVEFVAVLGVVIGSHVWRQTKLDKLKPGQPLAAPYLTKRLATIAEQQRTSITVYSRDTPFLGSGWQMAEWGLPIRLTRATGDLPRRPSPEESEGDVLMGRNPGWDEGTEFPTPPFDAVELIDHVRKRLISLASDQTHEGGQPAFTVESRVLLADNQRPDTDDLQLSEAEIHQIMRAPTTPARHYLACQVVSSRGELVNHVYLTFDARRTSLYVDLSAYVLPPTRQWYEFADHVGNSGSAARLRAAWQGFLAAPKLTFGAPYRLMRAVFDVIVAVSSYFRWARHRRWRNQGAWLSLREYGSDPRLSATENHDAYKWARTIERQTIAFIYEFLESRKVDITEYRQRTINILNEGIWNNGNLRIEGGVAVGSGARTDPRQGRDPS